jgi:hypothetical protein
MPRSIFSGDNVSDLVVELSNPQLSGDDLTYDARVLEGSLPANGGACALFIDIIGMPATPILRRCCSPCLASLAERLR